MPEGAVRSVMPLLPILFPWISLLAIAIFRRRALRLRLWLCFAGSALSFLAVIVLLPSVLDGKTYYFKLASIVEGLEISLYVDTLGYYFSLVLAFMWMLCTLYSISYIDHKQNRYFAFLAMCGSFLIGAAYSRNMFTYFIFYEMMTFGSYPLIIHEETAMARRAGYKYLVYAIGGDVLLFFAIITNYFWGGGNVNFDQWGLPTLAAASKAALLTIFSSYIAGFGVKAAIMPLHGWVPDAHPAAPSPASALLSGVILKAGAFGIMRVIFNLFGIDLMKELGVHWVVAVFACITIVLASVFALTQDNLKRRLAYSSIGQVSYIILGLTMVSRDGTLGGIMQLAHHALMKACLFLCAGVILVRTGKKNISDMKGVGYQLPVSMICFSVCALAMVGTPPSVGFITKWMLGSGAMEAGLPVYVVVLLVSSLLNAAYFLPIIYVAFFRWEGDEEGHHHPALDFNSERDPLMMVPVVILALLVVVVGIWVTVPGFPLSLASRVADLVFP